MPEEAHADVPHLLLQAASAPPAFHLHSHGADSFTSIWKRNTTE